MKQVPLVAHLWYPVNRSPGTKAPSIPQLLFLCPLTQGPCMGHICFFKPPLGTGSLSLSLAKIILGEPWVPKGKNGANSTMPGFVQWERI